jgi:RHS repeat-associated protein
LNQRSFGQFELHNYWCGCGVPAQHLNSNNSPFKFNGKEYDEETGNYYYSARYYDPKLSIFISVDPLVHSTFDAYGYCYQNPVNYTDPTGMSPDGVTDFYQNIETKEVIYIPGYSEEIDGWVRSDDFTFTPDTDPDVYNDLPFLMIEGNVVSKGVESKETASSSVGQPKGLEKVIPIWGSGRAAIDDFQNGRWFSGTFNSLLAISDVFLVKSLVTGIVKGGIKMAGSHSWSATRSYYLKKGFAKPQQPLHHWLIQQRGPIGKYVPNAIKNQMWNLKSFKNASIHMRAGHGKTYLGQQGYNSLGRLIYGTPNWPKFAGTSYGGRGIEGLIFEDEKVDESNKE